MDSGCSVSNNEQISLLTDYTACGFLVIFHEKGTGGGSCVTYLSDRQSDKVVLRKVKVTRILSLSFFKITSRIVFFFLL